MFSGTQVAAHVPNKFVFVMAVCVGLHETSCAVLMPTQKIDRVAAKKVDFIFMLVVVLKMR
jgi:hypothetical protein